MFPLSLSLLLSNDVYLCICDKKYTNISCNCKSFKSFIEAKNYYLNKHNNNNNNISTMISTKYIPHIFKKYYLNNRLSEILVKVKLN